MKKLKIYLYLTIVLSGLYLLSEEGEDNRNQALILTRRQLWYKVSSEGFLDTILDMYQALELTNRVIQFFDRATYYAALGYKRKI